MTGSSHSYFTIAGTVITLKKYFKKIWWNNIIVISLYSQNINNKIGDRNTEQQTQWV